MQFLFAIAALVVTAVLGAFTFQDVRSEPLSVDEKSPAITQTVEASAETQKEVETSKKIQETDASADSIQSPPSGGSVISVPEVPSQESETAILKVAKCDAERQSARDVAIAKLNQATEARLQEVFKSLNDQHRETVNAIYASADANITRITNDPILSASAKISLAKQYNDDAAALADAAYRNQQTFWQNQKTEIEASKQKALDQINSLLSEEYGKYLSK